MDNILDSLIDSAVDGISSLFDNADSILESVPDMIDEVSDGTLQALTNGNFSDIDHDFSNLFDTDSSNLISADDLNADVSEGQINENDIAFTGSNDNSRKIQSLEKDLEKAKHNVDYYSNQISNFSEKTSATYQATCRSRLNEATSIIRDITSQIERLKKS